MSVGARLEAEVARLAQSSGERCPPEGRFLSLQPTEPTLGAGQESSCGVGEGKKSAAFQVLQKLNELQRQSQGNPPLGACGESRAEAAPDGIFCIKQEGVQTQLRASSCLPSSAWGDDGLDPSEGRGSASCVDCRRDEYLREDAANEEAPSAPSSNPSPRQRKSHRPQQRRRAKRRLTTGRRPRKKAPHA